ncbi:serine/threonine protein kinase [Microbacterium ginsengiterrae]|uniref:non-specific serine/threonine protein kinase n=1 Tax=Microbacterium ginsengiterrae TaxID=546115 RepID=A0A7W9FB99_9MICO|nr:serine/threonine protein kinase [Microbacterium ginsengiterrae]
MSRPPSRPPELPGFTYLQVLGTGGFADVFLYEQQMPKRRVAVKVLLADRISDGAAKEFADEANVMAMLSTHPAIVTIYQSGVAGDGRPYIVMENCPRPNLQTRARKEPLSVAEALRVGIQVAGAVETAHRAGVLHRDIKPANILVTEYNRPALTDFGIASTTGAVSEATGMSIPWSPPEFFADPPVSGARSDVFALGATVYTLLAGRSPFERPGERNTSADLIERIERAPLPALSRGDSPLSLQQVLERAMAKSPEARYPSAVAFARALQKVQIELSHSVTPIDIVDDHPLPEDLEEEDDGLTRVRDIVNIEPDAGSTRPSATTRPIGGQRPAPTPQPVPRFETPASNGGIAASADTVIRPAAAGTSAPAPVDDDRTIARGPRTLSPEIPNAHVAPELSAPTTDVAAPRRTSKAGLWVAVAAVAAVLVGGTIVGVNLLQGQEEPDPVATQDTVVPKDPVSDAVPSVQDLEGERTGDSVSFRWVNPSPEDGDLFLWNTVDLAGDGATETTEQTTVTVEGAASGQLCIDVILRRDDGRASAPTRGCVAEEGR